MDSDERRLLVTIGVGLVVTVVGSVIAFVLDPSVASTAAGLAASFPLIVRLLRVGVAVVLVYLLIRYSIPRQRRLRSDMLVLSQRRISYPLLALTQIVLAGLILLLAGASPAEVAQAPVVYAVSVAVLAGLIVLSLVLLFRANRMYVKADQCYHLLRKLDDQRISEKFDFDPDAPAREIRREARVLDFMARQPQTLVRRGRLRYPWRYVFTEAAHTQISAGAKPQATIDEQQRALAQQANEIWRGGAKAQRWRTAGGEAQPVRSAELFGNQLDRLFNNGAGFRTYASGGPRFVTMVIKGPPGAGKSTLALQMSVTLAKQGNLCMYYSLEEERGGLLQSATNFGWDQPQTKESVEYLGVHHLSARQSRNVLRTRRDRLREQEHSSRPGPVHTSQQNARPAEPATREAQPDSALGIVLVSSLGHRAMSLPERKSRLRKVWGGRLGNAVELPEVVRCVVIDSLEGFANVGLNRGGQTGVPRNELLSLKDFFRHRCELLVILVEDDGSNTPGFVEFVADVVIQLGRKVEDGYTFLYAEIVKARNQTHALGQSQIKIRTQVDLESSSGSVKAAVAKLPAGIIVYPSLHYRLFQSQQQSTFDEYILSSGLGGLDEMLVGDPARKGLRRKSAIALLGPGGTGKSLMSMNFLIEGVRENTPTLLLSLRDDAGTVASRPVPQEPGRMQFSWGGIHNDDRFHQFYWDLDGILAWSEERREAASDTTRHLYYGSLRLPYLFAKGPVRYSDFDGDKHLQAQAAAITAFLEALATKLAEIQQMYPWPANTSRQPVQRQWRRIRWVDDARKRAAKAYDDAWSAFEQQLAAGTLVTESPGVPKRIRLLNVPAGMLKPGLERQTTDQQADAVLGETDPPPSLYWDSLKWDADAGKAVPDTSLLVVKDWRPGNITPDDFMDQVLRIIGEPTRIGGTALSESLFERVVFDDVSQLRQRFPFLAKTRLFVPTLIDMFKASGITSLFLADTDPGAEQDRDVDHGLATIADHVIYTSIRYRAPASSAVSGAGPTGSDALGTRAGSQPAVKLAGESGSGTGERIMVAEVRARPGSEQQVPHQLSVKPRDGDAGPDVVEMTRIE